MPRVTYPAALALAVILGACDQPVEVEAAQGSLQAVTVREPAPPPPPAAPPIDVDSVALWKAYQANEVAADDRFKGRQLKVVGVVDTIQKDVTGRPQLILRTPDRFSRIAAGMLASESGDVAKLSAGQKIVVQCEGAGVVLGAIALADCQLKAVW